jgi:phosphoribosylglycinamide formyltransferase 1
MVNKTKSCIFVSGNGSNLKSILKSSREYNFPISINLIISNKKNSGGLNLAKKYGISYKFFSTQKMDVFEKNCLSEIKKKKIKFLCLAGFMKMLSKDFIKKFESDIINIHPSLLPKFKGLNTHKRVLKSKEKYSGCTVHYVNSNLDSGKIILQKRVPVDKNETEASLKKKILIQEHKLYSQAIISIFK